MSGGSYRKCDRCAKVVYEAEPKGWLEVRIDQLRGFAAVSRVTSLDVCSYTCLHEFAAWNAGLSCKKAAA